MLALAMLNRRLLAPALLMLALPLGVMASAHAAEKKSLTAREIRHEVQCPLPRNVPCSISKPALAGYRVLNEKISLDDQGSYWIADLTNIRQQQGKNEPIRILTDNGVLHLINVKYSAVSIKNTKPRKADPAKDTTETKPPEKGDQKPKPSPAKKDKSPAIGDAKKPSPVVEACYERCRSSPEPDAAKPAPPAKKAENQK